MADTIYKTYDRFINAARKFPRWNNIRRRPTTSVGGALLRSIIDEIGKVEDVIIEYKKDFFIVNYIGKEDKIIDYLYTAQVGSIEDLDELTITTNNLIPTDDIKLFYKESGYAYYQDNNIVIKEKADKLEYSYNGFDYSVDLNKTHIWNVFDDFAWWAGLERFEDENNKSLLTRTINQFRRRPNSTDEGLRNVISNAISGDNYIDRNDIVIERPDEDNLYLNDSDGELIYEAISKFNRDIARTKQWDMDYWSNTFCSMGYLPHKWNAEVKNYQDGVGYNNSLYVSTVKDLNTIQKTDITISGYKQDSDTIEEYVRDNNITSNINISMKKYSDIINPVEVQYKIKASTLTHIESPELVFVDSYKTSKRELKYSIDELILGKDNGITVVPRNKLKTNENYVLKILPEEKDYSTMEIKECTLKHKNGSINLLKEKGSFGYNSKGLFINKAVLLHADSLGDFNSTQNLSDYRYGGLVLSNPTEEGLCTVNVSGLAKTRSQSLTISTDCELYDITNNSAYIKKVQGFTLTEDNFYISGTSEIDPSILTIDMYCKNLEFSIDKAASSLSSAYITIETYIDGELDQNNCYYNVNPVTLKKYRLKQYNLKQVKVVIKRNTKTAVKIYDIKANRYQIKAVTSDGIDISPDKKESVVLPQSDSKHYYVDITITNYGQTAPVINCVHVGANLNLLTATYTIDINTKGLTNPELIIKSNCRTDLYLKSNTKDPVDFSVYNLYTNNTTEYQGIYLDLTAFKEIYYSSPEIRYSNSNSYIQLKPGASIDMITIYGDNEKLLERKTLKDIFNISLGTRLYANKDIKSLVLEKGGIESKVYLTHDQCSIYDADTFELWSSKYKDIKYCFVSNLSKQVETVSDRYSGNFEYVYLYDKNTETSIAYNRQNIIKNITDDINIIKNFSPAISSFDKYLFIIENPVSDKYRFSVTFSDDTNFSITSSKNIKITCLDDLINMDTFDFELKDLSRPFLLSNNISLSKTYEINDEEIELGRYILTVPGNMKVVYDKEQITQERDEYGDIIYIEEDGFNKLLYSNIISLDKVMAGTKVLDKSEYSLLSEAGIIKWNNSNHTGAVLKITYTYNCPKALAYKDISYLYKSVGYNIDAFKKIDTLDTEYKVNNLVEGDVIDINYDYFVEKPEKISAICSNPCYSAQVDNDGIIIKKIAEDDSIVVHNGYYYIDGDEYYYFANKQVLDKSKTEGVDMSNIEKLNGLILRKESVNYLRNSKMSCDSLNVHCITDFANYKNVPVASHLESTGLCDNFTSWHSYAMNVTLSKNGINFSSLNNNGYAVLDITKALFNKDAILTCKHSPDLSVKLASEQLIDGQQISKSLYLDGSFELNSYSDSISYYNCSDLNPKEKRYYLVVTGSGLLSGIAVNQNDNPSDCFKDNIKRLGFDITEEAVPETEIDVDFSPTAIVFDGLELSKDFTLRTASTVDWGITKLADINLDKVKTDGFLSRFNSLIASKDNAAIETLPINIKSNTFVQRLYIKINDIQVNDLKDFDIEILGSDTADGEYNKIFSKEKCNFLQFSLVKTPRYIKIKVTAAENKIVNHLEVFALYHENADIGPGTIQSGTGSCTTKVYDLGTEANYKLKNVIQESNVPDKISFSIRGLKVSDKDNTWTEWYNINDNHIFYGYRYFQLKIYIPSPEIETKIKSFIFEVKE